MMVNSSILCQSKTPVDLFNESESSFTMGDKPIIAISHLGCEKKPGYLNICWVSWYRGTGWITMKVRLNYVIVNTCSFIGTGEESVAWWNWQRQIKNCDHRLYGNTSRTLLEELPEAVAVVGSGDYQVT